jgi:hypothetical protein
MRVRVCKMGGGDRERVGVSKLELHWNLSCFQCDLNFIDTLQFVITTYTVSKTFYISALQMFLFS